MPHAEAPPSWRRPCGLTLLAPVLGSRYGVGNTSLDTGVYHLVNAFDVLGIQQGIVGEGAMLKILDLKLGFSDAENYRRRENRDLLNKIFIRNQHLDRLCEPAISFLVGEKGTGKTAYSVYLSNNNYKNNRATIRYIRETEYQKFVSLKKEKHLELSEYASIWKVIIYLLLSQQLYEMEGKIEFLKRFSKLKAIQDAIDEYYQRAFSPEIIQALQFIQESKVAAELMAKYANASASQTEKLSFSESKFQMNLFYIQKAFEDALKQVKLDNNHMLFIDGIDIRPPSIPYPEYLECIKGLATAVWEVNNDFFPTIKDSKGRMRAVLLIRPDIFEGLNLQNQNTKIRDNAVFLNWQTEQVNHRNSDLFRVIDHLLASQQEKGAIQGEAWDHYFPWNAMSVSDVFSHPTSFIEFMRLSYYRPRDIITMLVILQEVAKEAQRNEDCFAAWEFDNPTFKRRYSDYLLGEIKDHLTFYYGSHEYELFLKFFVFLKGKRKFDYSTYLDTFKKFKASLNSETIETPTFMTGPKVFLQFLYDLNVISYIEKPKGDRPYPRWCYRERSYANISPKVREGLTYEVFYGLHKALNIGLEVD